MKRTKLINLDRMRKKTVGLRLKPLVLGVAAFSLIGCIDSRKANVYASVNHCVNENPAMAGQCEAAYQTAVKESARSGPKYRSERECISEFGQRNCVPYRTQSGHDWFMPAVAGFMMARALNNNVYHSLPLYSSTAYGSSMYGRWATADGRSYPKRYGSMNVVGDAFKPKPAVSRTMSRGGFGSTVAAKSNWGGRSSRSGWGG